MCVERETGGTEGLWTERAIYFVKEVVMEGTGQLFHKIVVVIMGNKDSLVNQQDWQTVLVSPQFIQYRHNQTGRLLNKYLRTYVDLQEFNKELALLKARQRFSPNQVQVVDVQRQGSAGMCSKSVESSVYTQGMKSLLKEHKEVPFQESAFILAESLKGFQELRRTSGTHFKVNDSLIGFSQDDRVKVWLNSDFSSNHPQEGFSRSEVDTEHLMIQSILQSCESHSVGSQFPASFSRVIQESRPFRFADLIKKINNYDDKMIKPYESFRQGRGPESLAPVRSLQSTVPLRQKKQLQMNLYSGPGSR